MKISQKNIWKAINYLALTESFSRAQGKVDVVSENFEKYKKHI